MIRYRIDSILDAATKLSREPRLNFYRITEHKELELVRASEGAAPCNDKIVHIATVEKDVNGFFVLSIDQPEKYKAIYDGIKLALRRMGAPCLTDERIKAYCKDYINELKEKGQ